MSDAIRAGILVTGDEVLGGRVPERNAAHIARTLDAVGAPVRRTVVVGDRLPDLRGALRELLNAGLDLICVTGGLGPTYDDLTMQAVAEETGNPLRLDPDALEMVERRSRDFRRYVDLPEEAMEQMRRKQATIPSGASVLPPIGTAPGCVLAHGGSLIVVLPGPPSELVPMWESACAAGPVADLLARGPGNTARTLRVWWVFEAELMAALDPLPESDLARLGTYTRDGELEVVVPADLFDRVAGLIRGAFPDALFAVDGTTVDEIVACALRARSERVAVAESCTGGGLGARMTSQPGSSEWFDGGVIAYANTVKTRLLGVPEAVLATDGAVSEASARAMAEGVRSLTGAAWGVAITGIAGPEGGTPDKPVGLVWIAVAGPAGTASARHRFLSRDRATIRHRAEIAAMHHLRIALKAAVNAG